MNSSYEQNIAIITMSTVSYDPSYSFLETYSVVSMVFGTSYSGSISDEIYHPKYNSAPGERSGDGRHNSLTIPETQAQNTHPNLAYGNDWFAMASESHLFSSLEDYQGKLQPYFLLPRDLQHDAYSFLAFAVLVVFQMMFNILHIVRLQGRCMVM